MWGGGSTPYRIRMKQRDMPLLKRQGKEIQVKEVASLLKKLCIATRKKLGQNQKETGCPDKQGGQGDFKRGFWAFM